MQPDVSSESILGECVGSEPLCEAAQAVSMLDTHLNNRSWAKP
jgi:hypothetical protein